MMIPAKLRHKRAAQHDEQEAEQHPDREHPPGPSPQQPARDSRSVAADLADDGAERSAKALRITTSKILGTAQPRKPRIGPEFQAAIPPLPVHGAPAPRAPPPQQQEGQPGAAAPMGRE